MRYLCLLVISALSLGASAQTIQGQFSRLPKQTLRLKGLDDFGTYLIDSTTTDAEGRFHLAYGRTDHGMGLLQAGKNKPLMIVLGPQSSRLKAEAPHMRENLQILQGQENQALVRYSTEQPKREEVLNAWAFLQKYYQTDSLLLKQSAPRKAIQSEIARLRQAEQSFVDKLPPDSYVKWFLPRRKLLSSVSQVAQYRTDEIPATREALQALNYADERWKKSGLLKEAIENHIWFIENSSGPLDSVYKDLNHSIDRMLGQFEDKDARRDLIARRWFTVLEERSLFTSSEYLARQLLADTLACDCLQEDLAHRLHKYGEMAEGKTAPDIKFGENTFFSSGVAAPRMSALDAQFYVVVFAAGWCPHCTKAMPKLARLYPEIKEKEGEVILVSLDESPETFTQFAKTLPFISTSDFKKWQSQAVLDYHVYATPTYYLLDGDRKILKELKNVRHIKAWIEQRM